MKVSICKTNWARSYVRQKTLCDVRMTGFNLQDVQTQNGLSFLVLTTYVMSVRW